MRSGALGRADRVDKFNGIYGMLRGLSAALFLLSAAAVVVDIDWKYCALLTFAAVVSLITMHRFGWLYGLELAVSYLAMRPDT